jgi:hypothetical protein
MPASNTTNPLAARLPPKLRRKLIERRVDVRRRLDGRRPLPSALVIGAQRCGTSSLYKWLEGHPDVVASVRKETAYFSHRFHQGESWYRAHFASRARHWVARRRGRTLLGFEATPDYLLHPLAPARAAAAVPSARIIVLLRDPVARTLSGYAHTRRSGLEELPLEEAIAAEASRVEPDLAMLRTTPDHPARELRRFSYVTRGEYAEQLARWLAHYDRSQLLVVRSEDLFDRPGEVFDTIVEFLGLRPWRPKAFGNRSYPSGGPARTGSSTAPPHVVDALRQHFRPHNMRLAELLGRDLGWDEPATR